MNRHTRLAVAGGKGMVRVVDARTGKPQLDLPGHGEHIPGVAWSAGLPVVRGGRIRPSYSNDLTIGPR